jgi:hypothetical protein
VEVTNVALSPMTRLLLAYVLGTMLFVGAAVMYHWPIAAGVVATPILVRLVVLFRTLSRIRLAPDRGERGLLRLMAAREFSLAAFHVSVAIMITIRLEGPRNPAAEAAVFISLLAWAITRQLYLWQRRFLMLKNLSGQAGESEREAFAVQPDDDGGTAGGGA